MDNLEEKFPLVDEEGRVIGSATRGECHNGSRLLHPVVHLHVFNSVDFTELNKDKCASVQYLSFSENKARIGLVMGERDGVFRSPFSAPFGGFDTNQPDRIEYYEEAVGLLKAHLEAAGKPLKIVLPPTIYGSYTANYAYELDRFPDYESYLDRSARKNFHNARQYPFEFLELERTPENIARAYAVIRDNRESKGYALQMSLESVLQTAGVVAAEFFVMSLDGADVAAAMVYPVTEGIDQVIYWGDAPGYTDCRAMNYFTYKIFEHYCKKGLKILDIGPSSVEGVPNYGLCSFKENLGCTVSLRHVFQL